MTQEPIPRLRAEDLGSGHAYTYALGYLDARIESTGHLTVKDWNEALDAAMAFEQRRHALQAATPDSM